MSDRIYAIQSSFNAGEISPEVANRSDLDKYVSALTKAQNVLIKPYGAVYKRPGFQYCDECKVTDGKVRLIPFHNERTSNYVLEVGAGYIRVYKNGVAVDVEIATTFTEDDLPNLRFAQSADTMFIASGTHNIQVLVRYSDNDWRMNDFDLSRAYVDLTNGGTTAVPIASFTTPGTYSFTPGTTGTYHVVLAAGGGGGGGNASCEKYSDGSGNIQTGYGGTGGNGGKTEIDIDLTAGQEYTIVVGAGGGGGASKSNYVGTAPSGTNGGNTTAFGYTANGGTAGTGGSITQERHEDGEGNVWYLRTPHNGSNGTSYGSGGAGGGRGSAGQNGFVTIAQGAGETLTPSATTGNITITSSGNTFTESMIGTVVKMWHQVPSVTVTASNTQTTNAIICGRTWSILTHGTWSGTIKIQYSIDGSTWRDYRTYTGSNDTNISESGTFDDLTYIRINQSTSGCTTDLTAQSYERAGTAIITAYTSASQVSARVVNQFGDTYATSDFAMSVWNDEYGYPRCIGFFQDRLVLAGNKRYPSTVWMSRTGDYYNFEVEEVDGQVTDDSAVACVLLSREEYSIRHIIAGSDLLVLTEGNEWIISGSSTVKPAEVLPKSQTSYGCNEVLPNMVGGRLIYVQFRGKAAYDMGYAFESDSYSANDLTLLAKHLTRGCTLAEMAYVQEPDGIAYFVTSKGTINCLTYNFAQRVYAWSTIQTDGEIMSVAAIGGANDDELYAIIRRNINGQYKRYLEKLSYYPDESDNPHEFIMLDSAVTKEDNTEFSTIDGLDHLIGKEVQVLGDSFDAGKFTVDDNGEIHLTTAVKKAVIGLPYTMKIQLPNLDFNLRDGTMQGRFKKINEVFMRLTDSWGGRIGADEKTMDDITYDSPGTEGINLFTGDIKSSVPTGEDAGFELRGQITIVHDEPYPFNLASVVRVVTFGG